MIIGKIINNTDTFFLKWVFKICYVFYMLAHLNLETEFSSEIFDPCLNFIKFREKVDSQSKLSQTYLKFPITEFSVHF